MEPPPPSLTYPKPPSSTTALHARSAAATPVVLSKGRIFRGVSADFEDLAVSHGGVMFGGALSIAFTARWDSLQNWSRILDFGNGPDNRNIFIANKATSGTIAFHFFARDSERRLHVDKVIVCGQACRYLFVIDTDGHMKIFQDGKLLGESGAGPVPERCVRRCLLVGKSHYDRDAPFHGIVRDVAVWDAVVDWDTAAASESADARSDPPYVPPTSAGASPMIITEADEPSGCKIMIGGMSKDLAKGYFMRGIVFSKGPPNTPGQFYRCERCNAGPFNAIEVIDMHFRSRKHRKTEGTWPPPHLTHGDQGAPPASPAPAAQPIASASPAAFPASVIVAAERPAPKSPPRRLPDFTLPATSIASEPFDASASVETRRVHFGEDAAVAAAAAATSAAAATVWKPPTMFADEAGKPEPGSSNASHNAAAVAVAPVGASGAGIVLPPGWRELWHPDWSAFYYVDIEGRTSQWEVPPSYVHHDWTRRFQEEGKALWECGRLGLSFYELDASDWKRFVDKDGRTYWSNSRVGQRFYEEFTPSPSKGVGRQVGA